MKKILHIFPQGVLITSKEKNNESPSFTNEMFVKEIGKIRDKLNELDRVKIQFRESKEDAYYVKSRLLKFLNRQETRITQDDPIIENEVTAVNLPIIGDGYEFDEEEKKIGAEDDLQDTKKSFNLKSLEVEWEGKLHYMHVFIDTTGIIKLEEAKSNIKGQKIMFASASHEFRTPLNAITNSFKLIKNVFDRVISNINNGGMNKKVLIYRDIERIK